MHNFYISFLLLTFTSCAVKVHYMGQKSAPVNSIDVFVSAESVTHPYTIVGKGYLSGADPLVNVSKIQAAAEKTGKEMGADAVIITDYYIANTGGAVITSTNKSDSIGKSKVSVGTTSITPTSTKGYNILYLKYFTE